MQSVRDFSRMYIEFRGKEVYAKPRTRLIFSSASRQDWCLMATFDHEGKFLRMETGYYNFSGQTEVLE